MKYRDIPQFTRQAGYAVDVSWDYLPEHIKHYQNDYKLDLDPDFQRPHVWDDTKRTRYVEYILRGGIYGRDVYLNCTGWDSDRIGACVLVDGKQRIEAVCRFLDNKLPIFGGHYRQDFEDRLRITGPSFKWHVNSLKTRAEVLSWYLDLNSGGVVHTEEELDRVRQLLEEEKAKNAQATKHRGPVRSK